MKSLVHERVVSGISACLIDIDATITDNRGRPQIAKEHVLNNAIFNVIVELMCEQGWEREAASHALCELDKAIDWWGYPDFLKAFNLPEAEAWKRIVQWHDEHVIPYGDAVNMVKRLHAAGMPLFIISNNPLSGCLLKLHRAGLSGLQHSEYFREIFGTDVCMGLKDMVGFWERCLDRTGFPPDQIAVIGDNPKDDCTVPRTLGIETIFLVDRKRKTRVERTPEAFLVNTLDCVPDLLLPDSQPA